MLHRFVALRFLCAALLAIHGRAGRGSKVEASAITLGVSSPGAFTEVARAAANVSGGGKLADIEDDGRTRRGVRPSPGSPQCRGEVVLVADHKNWKEVHKSWNVVEGWPWQGKAPALVREVKEDGHFNKYTALFFLPQVNDSGTVHLQLETKFRQLSPKKGVTVVTLPINPAVLDMFYIGPLFASLSVLCANKSVPAAEKDHDMYLFLRDAAFPIQEGLADVPKLVDGKIMPHQYFSLVDAAFQYLMPRYTVVRIYGQIAGIVIGHQPIGYSDQSECFGGVADDFEDYFGNLKQDKEYTFKYEVRLIQIVSAPCGSASFTLQPSAEAHVPPHMMTPGFVGTIDPLAGAWEYDNLEALFQGRAVVVRGLPAPDLSRYDLVLQHLKMKSGVHVQEESLKVPAEWGSEVGPNNDTFYWKKSDPTRKTLLPPPAVLPTGWDVAVHPDTGVYYYWKTSDAKRTTTLQQPVMLPEGWDSAVSTERSRRIYQWSTSDATQNIFYQQP